MTSIRYLRKQDLDSLLVLLLRINHEAIKKYMKDEDDIKYEKKSGKDKLVCVCGGKFTRQTKHYHNHTNSHTLFIARRNRELLSIFNLNHDNRREIVVKSYCEPKVKRVVKKVEKKKEEPKNDIEEIKDNTKEGVEDEIVIPKKSNTNSDEEIEEFEEFDLIEDKQE